MRASATLDTVRLVPLGGYSRELREKAIELLSKGLTKTGSPKSCI